MTCKLYVVISTYKTLDNEWCLTEMMTYEYREVYLYCNMRLKETEGDK